MNENSENVDLLSREILNQIGAELVVYNKHLKFEFVNPAEEPDPKKRESMIGKDDFYWCEFKGLPFSIAEKRQECIKESLIKKKTIELEEKLQINSFEKVYIRSFTPILDENNSVIKILRYGLDITDRKKYEKEIAYNANHDQLTGLANRRLLYSDLKEWIEDENNLDRNIAILLLDLDRFKTINDALGHKFGDTLIRSVADRMLSLFSSTRDEYVYRLGGDEFVVVVLDLASDKINQVCSEIVGCFQIPFRLGTHQLFITTSVGAYQFNKKTENSDDLDEMIHKADIAMYRAKESGRNKYEIFHSGMDATVASRFVMETNLYKAIEAKEFTLQFQPKLDVAKRKIRGAEALLRWVTKDGKTLYPKDFLDIAEDSGILLLLRDWIIKKALEELMEWRKISNDHFMIAVNLSERQFFDEAFIPSLTEILKNLKLPAGSLEFEINENIIIKNPDKTLDILDKLHVLGVSLSIDNFGSGYSPLGKMKNFAVDIINIDKSFIKDITDNYQDAAITGAIVAMAHRLGIKVNAEGIENKEQLLFMKYLKCEIMQGYFFSPPVDPLIFREYILKPDTFLYLFIEEY